MNILHTYIIGKYIKTLAFISMLLGIIIAVFDLSEKVTDFIHSKAPLSQIVLYYINFLPFFLSQFMPLLIFLVSATVTSGLAKKNEIITLFISKQNYTDVFKPYFLVILAIGAFNFIATGYLIPPMSKKKIEFLDKYVHEKWVNGNSNFHLQIDSLNSLYFQSFDNINHVGYNMSIAVFDTSRRLIKKVEAEKATYLVDKKTWKLNSIKYKTATERGDNYAFVLEKDTVMDIDLSDFDRPIEDYSVLNNTELDRYYVRQKNKGAPELENILVEKYKRISNSISIIIMGLLGISISFRNDRKGMGNVIFLGILLCFSYILLQQFTTISVIKANLNPLIGVFSLNIIYLIILWILYKIYKF